MPYHLELSTLPGGWVADVYRPDGVRIITRRHKARTVAMVLAQAELRRRLNVCCGAKSPVRLVLEETVNVR